MLIYMLPIKKKKKTLVFLSFLQGRIDGWGDCWGGLSEGSLPVAWQVKQRQVREGPSVFLSTKGK